MIYVGIDVAKKKHVCRLMDEFNKDLCPVFTVTNSLEGFNELYRNILTVEEDFTNVSIALESTGHYSLNIVNFLLQKGFSVHLVNPLLSKRFSRCVSLQNAKNDKIDTRSLARMLTVGLDLKPYVPVSYHIQQLKEYCRYRCARVADRSAYKVSVLRLIDILFPELGKSFNNNLNCSSVYSLLSEFSSAQAVASANLTRLVNLLHSASNGRYGKNFAVALRDTAKKSIGTVSPARSFELQNTIEHIRILDAEIEAIEQRISAFMVQIDSPITSIPGIGIHTAAVILSEIGDFSRFSSPDKILAYAGLVPYVYQSGEYSSTHCHLVKHGSKYLRSALFLAARTACIWNPKFKEYLRKKTLAGKHYNVIITAVAKKLVRIIFALEKSRRSYDIDYKPTQVA